MALLIRELTRVMYHAHMEQHSRMSATLVTVMSVLYQKLCKRPLEEMALT